MNEPVSSSIRSWWTCMVIAGSIVVLDQFVKQVIRTHTVRLLLPLLLLFGHPPDSFPQSRAESTASKGHHDPNHALLLASDADFLAAMISLSEESLQASLTAAQIVRSKTIKTYATNAAARYRRELSGLRRLLGRHGLGDKPDFHFVSKMPDLPKLSGIAAEKYYLSGSRDLLAAKIELAEFASGTANAPEVRRLATRVIETKVNELMMVGRWREGYTAR